MRQRAFEFAVASEPALDLFIAGRNAELLERLRAAARGQGERCIYIWGPPGSGRTHLLKGTLGAAGGNAAYVNAAAGAGPLNAAENSDAVIVAVDDVEELDAGAQAALFNLYNALRERGGTFLAAGNVPPMRLPLRPDVITRLGWGLVYEVHGLSDEEKSAALTQRAMERGFALAPEVRDYLLSRVQRDMPTLLAMLDALDRYSLEEKRAITVPLVRELLERP